MEEEWQTEHFNNRRIAHGRKGKGGSKGGAFEPRRTYGTYQLKCPAVVKMAGSKQHGSSNATLEVHGPVEGREDALMCTIDLSGKLSGVAILAGSRKVLNSVIRGLEEVRVDADEDAGDGSGRDDADNDDGDQERKSSIELADERERKRYAAFEKNSFRSPKFWVRWRAFVSTRQDGDAGEDSSKTVEVNGGFIVFAGNDCASFQGTISCNALEWKNVKLTGTKMVSKARESQLKWNEVVLDE